ncbi:MAG TPA: M20/M25/M40 family metallo-hydrolase [Halanaerobiales bacterium]|nr:M20/M25/M40 family metallo-hydrolase [Halanaerobiales bacterium]
MANYEKLADKYWNDIESFASKMIKIKSYSGEEKELADFVLNKFEELDYDEIWRDKAGNVVGKIKGANSDKSLILNCHLDTVSVGNEEAWEYPPFSGEVTEEEIWGRGASDTKGTFALQVYSAAILKKEDMLPDYDIYVTGVVHEEDSGLGSIILSKNIDADYAIVGEATENDIAIGHRGRIRYDVHIKGRAAHASIPEEGINPHFFMAKFIEKLKYFELEVDEFFGKSSLAPTIVKSNEDSSNIIPGEIVLTIDYRNVPSDTPEKIEEKLQKIIDAIDYEGEVVIDRYKFKVRCYTGLEEEAYQGEPAFSIPNDHELVIKAKNILEKSLDQDVKIKKWEFATDSGHYKEKGVDVIGFSPAEIKYCHTVEDKINKKMMKKGLIGYISLLKEL